MELSTRLFVPFVIISVFCLSHGYNIKRTEKEESTIYSIKRQILCLLNKDGCEAKISKDQRMYNEQPDKIVYLNGRVYTVDKSTSWNNAPEEAIVIDTKSGKIEFVGSDWEAEYYITEDSLVYDIHGSVVLPGLHDIHMHPLEAMSPIGGACILPNNVQPNRNEFKKEFKKCGGTLKRKDWLLGGGFSITSMLDYIEADPTNSPRELLDFYVPYRPAAIISETSHSIWVNSKALDEAGINSNTMESPGTVIMREPGSKTPNGIIFENGAMLINEIAMDPVKYPDILDLNYDGLRDAMYEITKNGITSICDARLFWKIKHDLAWNWVCDDGYLDVRAVLGAWAYPAEDDDYQIQKLKDLYSSKRDGCSLKVSQIKVYMDGIVESTTAAMEEPYEVNLSLPIISDQNIGLNYFNGPRLEKYLKALQAFDGDKGYDFHIHAIGDRGIREALDAIEAAAVNINGQTRLPRHRLTHLEIIDDADIGRFNSLDVIADFQLNGEFVLPTSSTHKHLKDFVGERKANSSIPVKRVAETGAMVTLSSDWDVSTLNPFVGIQYSAQRKEQSISVKQAIEMRTINSAYAMRQEDIVGSLAVGKDADIIVIDQDILDIPVGDIGYTRVLQTVFKGNIIHKLKNKIIEELDAWWFTDPYYK